MGLLSMVLDHECVVYILTLGVVDGWQGRGIASRLIRLVSQYAADTRCAGGAGHDGAQRAGGGWAVAQASQRSRPPSSTPAQHLFPAPRALTPPLPPQKTKPDAAPCFCT
jgi:GNAT superfamily N-acetyltransferase